MEAYYLPETNAKLNKTVQDIIMYPFGCFVIVLMIIMIDVI